VRVPQLNDHQGNRGQAGQRRQAVASQSRCRSVMADSSGGRSGRVAEELGGT
jgi:hypothetical protein